MYQKLKKYWQLFWQFRRLNMMVSAEYRSSFLFWTGVSLMWTIFNYFFFHVLVSVQGEIAGWDLPMMYTLASVYTILDSFTWSFFYHNMSEYTRKVFMGELSGLLLKPISTIFVLTFERLVINNLPRFLIGIGMLIWSVRQLDSLPTFGQGLAAIVAMLLGLTLMYALWFIMATFAFYFEKLDNINEIIPGLRRLQQVPRGVFFGLGLVGQSLILPLLLITNYPAELLIGIGTLRMGVVLLCCTAFTVLVAQRFFHFSVKRYVGVAN